jgi:hypothetical protein
LAVIEQAIGRLIRIGQLDNVFILDYRNMGSFHESVVLRNIMKAVPGLLTALNADLFTSDPNGEENETPFDPKQSI